MAMTTGLWVGADSEASAHTVERCETCWAVRWEFLSLCSLQLLLAAAAEGHFLREAQRGGGATSLACRQRNSPFWKRRWQRDFGAEVEVSITVRIKSISAFFFQSEIPV